MTIIIRSEKLDKLVPSAKKLKNRRPKNSQSWTKVMSTTIEANLKRNSQLYSSKPGTMATKSGNHPLTVSKRPKVPPLPPYSPLGGLQEVFKEVGISSGPEKSLEDGEDEADGFSLPICASQSCIAAMVDSLDHQYPVDDAIPRQSLVPVTTTATGPISFTHDSYIASLESISIAAARASTTNPLFYNQENKRQAIVVAFDSTIHPSLDTRPPGTESYCSASTCPSINPWSPVNYVTEETPEHIVTFQNGLRSANGPPTTLKRRLTIRESRMKALPPYPPLPENENSLHLVSHQSLMKRSSNVIRARYSPTAQCLPQVPQEKDLRMLDYTLRKNRRNTSLFPSLEEAAEDLEAHLLSIPSAKDGQESPRTRSPSPFYLEKAIPEEEEQEIISSDSQSKRQEPTDSYTQTAKLEAAADTGSIEKSTSLDTQRIKQETTSDTHSVKSIRMRISCGGLDRLRESIASKQKIQLPQSNRLKSVQSGLKNKWSRLSTFSKRGIADGPKLLQQLRSPKLQPVNTAELASSVGNLDFGLNLDLTFPAGFVELDGETSLRESNGSIKSSKGCFEPQTDGSIKSTESTCEPHNDGSIKSAKSSFKPLDDTIILRIFQNVSYFDDLFNLAITNRNFYIVYKQNELALIQNTLSHMSLPAWELREMSPPWDDDGVSRLGAGVKDEPVPEYTPRLYLKHYSRDLYTMAALKSMILVHCEGFLRIETSRALAGLDEKRSAEMDDAFWRVWTFCHLFGCGKGREGDIEAQVDWLRGGILAESDISPSASIFNPVPFISNILVDPPQGFAKGNDGGLSSEQLCDMSEIWTCLVALLASFHGNCKEARAYGVYDDNNVTQGDVTKEESLLEEWTQYILTLGPSAVLALISFGPLAPIEQKFARAKSLGWTRWQASAKFENEPSRQFFREAISRVCRDHPSRFASLSSSKDSSISSKISPRSLHSKRSSQSSIDSVSSARQRRAGFAAELRKRKMSLDTGLGIAGVIPQCDERPTPASEMVINKLIFSEFENLPLFSPPSFTAMTMSSQSQSSSQSLLTPSLPSPSVEEKISQGRQPMPCTDLLALYYSNTQDPIITDPADLALYKMVHELGFSEEDSKWALKRTDTGESVDINAAVHLLLVKHKKSKNTSVEMGLRQRESNIPQTSSDKIYRPTWKWA